MTFGEKLVLLRKARGMTQEQLAAELSVSRQAVSKWELGETTPETENVIQLSRLFGVTTDYLLFGAGPAPDMPADALPPDMPAQQSAPAPLGRAQRIVGWILTGLGGLGMLTLWVLSTMIESRVDASYVDDAGRTWYTTANGYSLSGFIETYRLQAIVGLCTFFLAAGLSLLLWQLHRRRDAQRAEKDEPEE